MFFHTTYEQVDFGYDYNGTFDMANRKIGKGVLLVNTRYNCRRNPLHAKNLVDVRGFTIAKQYVNKGLSLSNPKLIVQHGFRPPAALHCAPICTVAYLGCH